MKTSIQAQILEPALNASPFSSVNAFAGRILSILRRLFLLTALPVVGLPGSAWAACQPNAWNIDDTSTNSGSFLNYTRNLTPAQQLAATNNGWRMSMVSRHPFLESGFEPAHFMIYGTGERRFAVAFSFADAATSLRATLFGPTNRVVNLSGSWNGYHTHDLVYDPLTRNATYYFDGDAIHTWGGDNIQAQVGTPLWGSASSRGRGNMNYHKVSFTVNGLGVVAEYNAGFEGNPATAPDPTTQGWTDNAGAVAITKGPVSPDAGQSVATRVTNTNDSGPGSLRAAIANTCSGGIVNFDPAIYGSTIVFMTTTDARTSSSWDSAIVPCVRKFPNCGATSLPRPTPRPSLPRTWLPNPSAPTAPPFPGARLPTPKHPPPASPTTSRSAPVRTGWTCPRPKPTS